MIRCCILGLMLSVATFADDPKPLKLLFLGDNGHHRPNLRFRQLQPVMAKRGIEITYTDKVEALNPETLRGYDGLIIYANTTKISAEQEKALLDFVEAGKGFIPLHCASYCFLNSPKYIDLVGAQFLRHNTGTFRTTIAEPNHPIMKGFSGFESWDETYVHTKHNLKDRTVLEYRDEKGVKEPWTWVRTQGKGRIFYTAWGHDERTWGNPGFQNLVERGIRWACNRDVSVVANFRDQQQAFPIPEMTPKRTDVKPFEYVDVGKKIPNYTPSQRWGVQGEAFSKMQKPLSAEESMKHMVTPKGFHVELFATEEGIGGKPIAMNWDERGRLWVCVTYDYPNELQPQGKGRDRIVICEDTDGDGKADKFTVFADKLSIPTSLMFHRGGVIVFDGQQTLYLKDTDGDDKADVREVLFGRWSQVDTHGGPSNMQYGLDNWIWAMQGYNNSRLTLGGETHQFRQGFFRFKPDAGKMEFVRSTDNNTWGIGISEEGIIFGSTANRNPSVYMPIPNRYYEAVRGWAPSLMLRTIADTYLFKPITDKVRQVDQHGGYTAGAGHALYTARNYPQEYWNRTAFVNEPTGHLTGTFILKKDGSDFHSSNPFNLLASDDEWTAPIMAEVGPDGNVWVIDWYNYIVQHNPTPAGFKTGRGAAYESDLRDKKHGRIYRVVYDAKPGDRQFNLKDASPEKLVATLKHENMFWRKQAQRLLVERGKLDVLPGLVKLAEDRSVDSLGLNAGVTHALWAMHGLGALDNKHPEAVQLAYACLGHKAPGVRRNALQVLPRSQDSVNAILFHGLFRDPDAQVRLASLLALADQPATSEAGLAIVDAIRSPENAADRWIPDAATCAAANNSVYFLKALANAQANDKLQKMVLIVAEHYARGNPSDTIGTVVGDLAKTDAQLADAVVRGLAKGWPQGKKPALNDRAEQDLEKLAERLPPERRGQLVKLASGWGLKRFEKYAAETVKTLMSELNNESLSPEARVNAARELVGQRAGDDELAKTLLDLISPRTPPELAVGLLRAVQVSEAPASGTLILERLATFTPAARTAGLGVLLSQPKWTRAYLDQVRQGTMQLADLSLEQKQLLADYPDRGVRKVAMDLLRKGGNMPNADRQKVIDEMLSITKVQGDAAGGKLVFKNNCSKCHVHSGEGERIGPDLTGMAVHPKEELLTHIIDPSRSVEGNFRVYTVTTKKGQIFTGMLASESRTAIELFDAEAKKKTILRDEIDELVASTKSLMPDGFEKQINRKDFTDLLEFLTQKGKYLPLPLDKAATAVSSRGMFYDEGSAGERFVFRDWSPKTFQGIPFNVIDPRDGRVNNVVYLYGPEGYLAPKMPKSVQVPCNSSVKAIHMLSGVSGWGFPYSERGSTTLIVRLHYEDGKTEDHPLKNGIEFADYIRRVDVPGSQYAFNLQGKQIRYLSVKPDRTEKIKQIEFLKGSDNTAPIIMAVTIEP